LISKRRCFFDKNYSTVMLRANIDDIIKNSPYGEPVGSFLLGFSSTLIGFVSLFVLILIIYDYYRFNKNSLLCRFKTFLYNESEFVLPLYKKYKDENKKIDIEITAKPDLTAFVIPALNVEQVGLPLSPLSSGLKRRTISMNSFGSGSGSASAPTATPTRILTPFMHESKDKDDIVV
jgi:hypothetical protein